MLKLYLSISLNTNYQKFTNLERYRFYASRLTDLKSTLQFKLNKLKLSAIDDNLLLYCKGDLQPVRADIRPVSYQILNYIINHLKLFVDPSGEYFYSLDTNIYNPFSKTVSIDTLWRVLEFGVDKLKPTKLFRSSIYETDFTANRLLNAYKGE